MELLLDTHALIWWAAGHRALSRKVKRLIESDETKVWVSAATAWEIATKVRLGRGRIEWTSTESVESYCVSQRFELMAMTFVHAEKAGAWPQPHGDPFDRVLAAQSVIEGVALATDDPKLKLFGIDIVW